MSGHDDSPRPGELEPGGPSRLWAPWRIDYILGPKAAGCPFCFDERQRAKDLVPSADNLILVAREHTFVMLNRYPYTGCHLMVIPWRHVSGLQQLTDAECAELSGLTREDCGFRLRAEGFGPGRMTWGGLPDGALFLTVTRGGAPLWSGETTVSGGIARINLPLRARPPVEISARCAEGTQ